MYTFILQLAVAVIPLLLLVASISVLSSMPRSGFGSGVTPLALATLVMLVAASAGAARHTAWLRGTAPMTVAAETTVPGHGYHDLLNGLFSGGGR